MTLRYSQTPQYSCEPEGSKYQNLAQHLPKGARSMDSAPTNGGQPFWVFANEGDGCNGYLVMSQRGQFQKLYEDFDDRTGETQLRSLGESVSQPIAWAPNKPQR